MDESAAHKMGTFVISMHFSALCRGVAIGAAGTAFYWLFVGTKGRFEHTIVVPLLLISLEAKSNSHTRATFAVLSFNADLISIKSTNSKQK